MQKIANKFQNDNIGKGVVSNITSYCFTFTTNPKKESEKPLSTVYMKSYFLDLKNN